MNWLTRSTILAHRYLGIAISLLVIMWFASGIVMMYAGGMPRLTPQSRIERLPDLDLSRVTLTPAQAADAARARAAAMDDGIPRGGRAPGPRGGSGRVQLTTVLERPAYRVGAAVVFADTGDVLGSISLDQARTMIATFPGVPPPTVSFVRTLTQVDQWTLGQGGSIPLHKFRVDDADATEVYVQAMTATITTVTTRKSRALAWVGTIQHWLYFTALRANQPLWYRVVVWTSGAVCVLAALGLVLLVTQFRWVRPFKLSKAIPYSGWMRWHYITGAVFGGFTLTWAFSGLLSMEPFAWTNAEGLQISRDAFTGGAPDLSKFDTLEPAAWQRVHDGRGIKEMEFVRIQDVHYYLVRQTSQPHSSERQRERLHQPYYVTGQAERDCVLVNAETLEPRSAFSVESLMARLHDALPDVPVADSELLTDYDSYYYSRGRQTPLPVLRVKFADEANTWFYIDPEMSQVLAQIPRLARLERWLYNGLHSLDFPFWYNRRPLWDVGMITLLLGGLASSGLGLVMGVKRIKPATVRLAATGPSPNAAPVHQQAIASTNPGSRR